MSLQLKSDTAIVLTIAANYVLVDVFEYAHVHWVNVGEAYDPFGVTFSRTVACVLIIDTIKYWSHRFFHTPYMFEAIHYVHHSVGKPVPSVSFANNSLEIVLTNPAIVVLSLLCGVTFLEFIIVMSLAFVATASDHANTDPRAFHMLHHCGNKNTNFQQPFFTFWDRICGTYNHNTVPKIPLWPNLVT